MRFPVLFKRQKGSVSTDPALGSDTPPTNVAAAANADNVVFCRIRDVNGWPCHRIAFAWHTTGASPVAINFDAYFWEDRSSRWYKINDASISAKPDQLYFFDTATILEQPTSTASISAASSSATAGGMEVMLIATDPGSAVNGVYTIVAGPDMTPVGT
jgi:hypothetical protein